MAVQIVMDRSGDTRHEFDKTDATTVALAEERFRQLTGKGFRAVALGKDGSHRAVEALSKALREDGHGVVTRETQRLQADPELP